MSGGFIDILRAAGTTARALALRVESRAASAKSWAGIPNPTVLNGASPGVERFPALFLKGQFNGRSDHNVTHRVARALRDAQHRTDGVVGEPMSAMAALSTRIIADSPARDVGPGGGLPSL